MKNENPLSVRVRHDLGGHDFLTRSGIAACANRHSKSLDAAFRVLVSRCADCVAESIGSMVARVLRPIMRKLERLAWKHESRAAMVRRARLNGAH